MAETGADGYDARVRQLVELQAEVCYMNVDRTLATWTRTALSLLVFGTVIDRYGVLVLHPAPIHPGTPLAPDPLFSFGGLCLVAMGVFIALSAAIRHQRYRRVWMREYGHPGWHGPWLAFTFACMTVVAGAALLAALLVFRQ